MDESLGAAAVVQKDDRGPGARARTLLLLLRVVGAAERAIWQG